MPNQTRSARIRAALATCVAAPLALLATAAVAAPSVLLAPGQSVSPEFGTPTPAGTLVASESRPFSATISAADEFRTSGLFDLFADDGPDPRFYDEDGPATIEVTGTFSSSVYRDADGTLTFAYAVSAGAPGLRFGETFSLAVTGFAGLETIVGGISGGNSRLTRSADGDAVTVDDGRSNSAGSADGAATLVVDTDATAFDRGGSATVTGSDEAQLVVNLTDADEGFPFVEATTVFPNFSAPLADAFRPGAAVDGPAVIPLPAGAWAGLATLGGVGLVRAARRRAAATPAD